MRKVVPFGRTLGVGLLSRGDDVKAVQRALTRGGFGGKLARAFGIFGVGTRTRVKRAQKHYGLPQTGTYGLALHARLVEHFADYEIFLYTGHNPNESPEDRTRRKIVAAALAFYAYGPMCRYTQGVLRMTIVRQRQRPPFAGILFEDCSSSVTGFYWIGGADDPNDLDYNGQGYTGTLIVHGRSVSLAECKPADLVYYKSPRWWRFPYAHVAVVVVGGPNAKVISFGSAPPRLLPIDYRTDAYGRVDIRSYF